MCGIAGIIGSVSDYSLEKMLASQFHRGPDFTGTFFDEQVAIGHNRLSIIDCSSGSNQPFFDDQNRYALVFNGEIYNYVELRQDLEINYNFKTSGDTEVLLAAYIAYGKDCLNKLNGMFSFAIWDKENKTLFAARDRFGVKPFYYSLISETLLFSSEIKAIHAAGVDKIPNKKVWANYFVHGSYGMPEETFWQDVQRLPPGHFLEFDGKSISVNKWYDFELAIAKVPKMDYDVAKNHYLELLHDAISLRFRADVPVAINVSGGLDSSILLGLVDDYFGGRGNVNAYNFYTGDPKYDELEIVEKMVESKGLKLNEVLVTANEIPQLAEFIAKIQDEPFGGIPTLAYAKIFAEASKSGIKVLLDGQGMDEQWAGYDYYVDQTDQLIQGVENSPYRQNVLSDEFRSFAERPIYESPFDNKLQNLQYRDLFYTKIPRALRFCDRISMAYSTELREPFLDYRLVEFAFAQSADRKINDGVTKYMLRDLAKKYTSKSIADSEKRPLQTPQREWLGKELKVFVGECLDKILSGPHADWFDEKQLRQEWQNFLNGDNQSAFHVWQWVSFALIF